MEDVAFYGVNNYHEGIGSTINDEVIFTQLVLVFDGASFGQVCDDIRQIESSSCLTAAASIASSSFSRPMSMWTRPDHQPNYCIG